jgi:hypothetical protein
VYLILITDESIRSLALVMIPDVMEAFDREVKMERE